MQFATNWEVINMVRYREMILLIFQMLFLKLDMSSIEDGLTHRVDI
jgi:hypothetical protein